MEGDDAPSPSTCVAGGGTPPVWSIDAPGEPASIGRYRIVKVLGGGGFGRVYLAHDDDLDRPVAIKVPHRHRVASPGDAEAYLAEARNVARLDHPHIVPVHDVGRTGDGLCYVVSKFVEGGDLESSIRDRRPSHREAAQLVATVASALQYAHTRGLVHRDIKLANILVDAGGTPYLADFGLALRDEDFGRGAGFAGTPAYMSPEQARGEAHRVDGRSDIFSLGVVLYELLTGRRPFRSANRRELLEEIIGVEARPPRQIDGSIPAELERICLKALSKRATERYTTAGDMAEELRLSLEVVGVGSPVPAHLHPAGPPLDSTDEASPPRKSLPLPSLGRAVGVVPKGLRSFDEHDADFFLELLPGPRHRDGLPDSIRFWKTRIEATDPDRTFKVGLIYGPSGCGKSSLVKAGLLPRLPKHVHPVYVETSPQETESRLLRGLLRSCPGLNRSLGLVDAVAAIRRGRTLPKGHKALLVLDQFEQWLNNRCDGAASEMVAALRQCDGEHIQAVVLVRDDFWMSAVRLMGDLEIRLAEGENSASVDLFDRRHATKVLTAFGRAFGTLPEDSSKLAPDQEAFVDRAIEGLCENGRIIPVRLALFSQLVKARPWKPATLEGVGGMQGLGETFLEETFSLPSAPPENRLHRRAAQGLLKALLPRTGIEIRGEMKSEAELRCASGYENRPADFSDLIRILDAELRLITPADPDGATVDGPPPKPSGGRYYQFTHDYLVPSIRLWLTRKQRATERGQAELLLAERVAVWLGSGRKDFLLGPLDWLRVCAHTDPRTRSADEREYIARSGSRIGVSLAMTLVAIALASAYGSISSILKHNTYLQNPNVHYIPSVDRNVESTVGPPELLAPPLDPSREAPEERPQAPHRPTP